MGGQAVARAVDTVLRWRGYIIDDESPLAEMARETWTWWWSTQWRPPEPACASAMVRAARTLPWVNAWTSDDGEEVSRTAWVRPGDYVVDPNHSKLWTTGVHIPQWTPQHVTSLMNGVQWALTERPGGWASHVLTDGHNISCEVAAAGLPLVRVELGHVLRVSGRPYTFSDPARTRIAASIGRRLRQSYEPRVRPDSGTYWSSSTIDQVERLRRRGLCAAPDWSQTTPGPPHQALLRVDHDRHALTLPWVDPIFPWIVAERRDEVDARFQAVRTRWAASTGVADLP